MHVAYQLLSKRPAKAAVWAFVQLGTLSFNAPSSLVGRALPWKMDVFLHHCVHRVLQDCALWLYLSHVDDERFTQKKSLVLQFIKEGGRRAAAAETEAAGWLQPVVLLCVLCNPRVRAPRSQSGQG